MASAIFCLLAAYNDDDAYDEEDDDVYDADDDDRDVTTTNAVDVPMRAIKNVLKTNSSERDDDDDIMVLSK